MAKRTGQRIFIIVLALVMLVGTLGSFAVMILASENQQLDDQRRQEAVAEYQREYSQYQAKLDEQTEELSSLHYPTFSRFIDRPAGFDRDDVDELSTRDLVVGEGEVIDGETPFAAYYIGWNTDGTVFDSTVDGDSLSQPLYSNVGLNQGLDNASLIEGWIEGMKGMRIGGVREISIPSDLAYGEAGQGDDIPPNTPIKFVVMAIEPPDEIEQPDLPALLQRGF